MSTRPKDKREWLTPPEAAEIAMVSPVTIINWCKKNSTLGEKVFYRWRINKSILLKLIGKEKKNGKSR